MFSAHKRGLVAAVALGSAIALAPVLPASAANAPDCFSVKIDDNRRSDTVTVTNNCTRSYNVKIVWAWETDSPCTYVYQGNSFSHTRDYPARFDGLVTC